jgi:hypothetical protein
MLSRFSQYSNDKIERLFTDSKCCGSCANVASTPQSLAGSEPQLAIAIRLHPSVRDQLVVGSEEPEQ